MKPTTKPPREENSMIDDHHSSFKIKKIDISQYKPLGKSDREKLAHFYLWARDNYPKIYIDDSMAARAVCQVERAHADHIAQIRKAKYLAKRLLMREFNTTLHSKTGLGTRALVDDDD